MRRLLAVITLAIAFSGSAFADRPNGRTSNKTYATMTAAAKAGGAYAWSKFNRSPVHASDVAVTRRGMETNGKVRTVTVFGPKTPMGYREGALKVKVEKLQHGWKAYTNTAAKPLLYK